MGLLAARIQGTAEIRSAVAHASAKTTVRTLKQRFSKGEVEWSPDLERVLGIPRRSKPELQFIMDALTATLKKPEGTQRLRELQAWALWEGPQVGGLLAPIQTGGGKTLVFCLMPMVWPRVEENGIRRPVRAVLFIPPDMRAQFAADWERYSKHWQFPNLAGGKYFTPGLPILHVLSYSELSHTKSSALLDQIKPDLFMGDEISALRNFETSRVRRVRKFFADYPESRLVGADASITSDSIEDFWHLLAWALGDNSPLPLDQAELRRWARALDPERYEDGYFMPGALMRLCEAGESPRSGFQRRLVDTKGVVASEDNQLGIPLLFSERRPPTIPEEIQKHLKTLRKKPTDGGWKRPDGEELREATEVVACAKQLAQGMWLYWAFPRGEPRELIDDWKLKRQNWNREVRAVLQSPRVHMDSPKLCENAAERWFAGGCPGCERGPQQEHASHCTQKESHPLWDSYCFQPWRAVKNTVFHETRVKWESDWLLQDAAAWASEKPGIVWVDHPAFGHKLSSMTGFTYYGGGDDAAEELATEFAEERGRSAASIICSMAANKRGKNLQFAFNRNLIVAFPASNDMFEQLVGRTARPGQSERFVSVEWYLHTAELENALEKAKERAVFVSETMGTPQKLIWGKFT